MVVDGIVLAAGLSTRMGRPKLTLPLGNKTVIEHTVRSMLPHCATVFVVIHGGDPLIGELLGGMDRVELVINEHAESGMFSSVRAGMGASNADAVFLLPGDCPLIAPTTFSQLYVGALHSPHAAALVPVSRGRKGHPILMRSLLKKAIIAADDSTTLRDIVEAAGFLAVEVDDATILFDMDTPADYDHVVQTLRRYGQ